MKPLIFNSGGWHIETPVDEGVQADLLVGFDRALTLRRVRYWDPEIGADYKFLTSVTDLEPGLITRLYLSR